MKWTLRLLIAAALGLALALSGVLGGGDSSSGREILEQVRAGLGKADHDPDEALRRLGTALRLAEIHGPRVLAAEVLETRARLLLEIGATDAARLDIETVLQRYLPGDQDLRMMLVAADLDSGDLERGLATTADLLADAPDLGPALVASGRLHERLAGVLIAQCHEILQLVLVAEDGLEARRLLTLLAARAPMDPGRATNALQLQALFPPGEEERLARILALADEATENLRMALRDHTSSLSQGYLDPAAIDGILRSLTDSGHAGLAADLGMLARSWPEVEESVAVSTALLQTLLERGDHTRATDIAQRWVRRRIPLEPEFLNLLAEALFHGERWNALLLCANQLGGIGSQSQEAANLVYRGFSLAALGREKEGASLLRRFAARSRVSPIPGMRAHAWLGVADASLTLGDPFGEREALHEYTRLAPEDSGVVWYRLAEIQLNDRRSGLGLPLESIVQAMRLEPRRTEELLETFVEVGEQLLEAEGRDMEVLFSDLREELYVLPRRALNAYELHRLCELYAADGADFGVLTATRQMLGRYPGFLPALDLQIGALIRMGRMREAAELCVQRLEYTGRDHIASELLGLIPADTYSGAQLVRLMFADPARIGRLKAAAHLRARGDQQGALDILQRGRTDDPDGEVLREICAILGEQGKYGPALAAFEHLHEANPQNPGTDPLELVCALRSDHAEHVRTLVDALAGDEDAEREDISLAADTLLRLGAAREGTELLGAFARLRQVDGPLLLRAGLCALAAGDLEQAEGQFDRAEPFLPHATAAIARILLDSRREDWAAVADSVAGLSDDGPSGSSRVAALAALLGANPERTIELCSMDPEPDAALPILIEALARLASGSAPGVPAGLGPNGELHTVRFALGKRDARRSPLHAAALLLALETPGFRAFAAHELRRLGAEDPTNPWPAILEAEACLRLGAQAEAENILWGVTARQAQFAPAWDLLEHAVRGRVRTPDHPQLSDLRERRLTSRARLQPDSPEGLVLLARKDRQEGLPRRAQAAALAALQARPDWVEALAEAGRAATLAGDHQQALTAWRKVLLEHSPHEAQPFVPDLLEALAQATASPGEGLEPRTEHATLEEVAASLPDDPRLALARARLALAEQADNPALGIARAFGHLDAFLAAHSDTTLESLQPGSSEAWARFYVAIDPEVAQAFLRSQREREPGNLELWLQLGRVLRRGGAIDEATLMLMRASRISPDPRFALELARTTITKSVHPRAVRALVGPQTRAAGGRQALEAQLISARAELRQVTRKSWLDAARALEAIWRGREWIEHPDLARELGELYAIALLLRGDAGDEQAALAAVAVAIEGVRDPYRLTYLRAIGGLARVGRGDRRP
jgi:tetratricopeptide (TPR) repeat protein